MSVRDHTRFHVRPNKPINKMNDEELAAFASEVCDMIDGLDEGDGNSGQRRLARTSRRQNSCR